MGFHLSDHFILQKATGGNLENLTVILKNTSTVVGRDKVQKYADVRKYAQRNQSGMAVYRYLIVKGTSICNK